MGKSIDIQKFTSSDLSRDKISELVRNRKSFQVVAVKNISSVVNNLEGAIEKQGMRCRVYTEYRSAALAGMAVPTGITQVMGIYSAIGIAAHNAATFNPDYEIAKNKPKGRVTVIYKK